MDVEAAWQERQDAEIAVRNYLDDIPSTSFTVFRIPLPSHTYSNHRLCPWTPGKWQVKNAVSHTPGQEAVTSMRFFLA